MIILIFLLSVWMVCEIVTIGCQGVNHYIKGNGRLLLEKELTDCFINSISNKIICLKNKSELNGRYISKTETSILFPYYFSSINDIDYGILIFSKEYFIVKNKFKELRNNSKNKRIKFSRIV